MTDDHHELIEAARRRHLESDVRLGACAWCLSRWPCITTRLAEALETERAEATRAYVELNGCWLAAERRVAELEQSVDHWLDEVNRKDGEWNVLLTERDALARDLAAARAVIEKYARHATSCPCHKRWHPVRCACDLCTCGLAVAIGAPEKRADGQ